MSFPGEPIGAEAAIFWHLQQIDCLQFEAANADACEQGDIADRLEAQALQHQVRLAELEGEFPDTAKKARDDVRRDYQERAEKRRLISGYIPGERMIYPGSSIATVATLDKALRIYRELLGEVPDAAFQ